MGGHSTPWGRQLCGRGGGCSGGLQGRPTPPALTQSLSPGFVRVGGDTRLLVVRGPVSSQPRCEGATVLPAALTAAATHFQPIVLVPDAGDAR